MFNLFNLKKVISILFTFIVLILIYFFSTTYLVKKNINSLNTLSGNINQAYYNPFKNNLLIKGLSLKTKNNDELELNIIFDKIVLSFDSYSLFSKSLIIKNLLITDGIIKIDLNSKNSNEKKLKIYENKFINKEENYKNKPRKKFVIEKLNFDSDLKFTKNGNELLYSHFAAIGNNISNFKKGNINILGGSYIDKNLFNTLLNINYIPNFEKDDYSFDVSGYIENVPSNLSENLFRKVKLKYNSLCIESYIDCKNKNLDGSKIILKLNDVDVSYKNYSTHISQFQFPVNLKGNINSIKIDYSEGLDMLKEEAAQNLIHILGEKFKEEYDRIEDQAKRELRRLDDNLGISEIDDKFKEEYDRIEDQAKRELRRLDDNLGISEIDDKIDSLKKIIFERHK